MANRIDLADLEDLIGQQVGTSDWLTVDQARIDLFAEATGDHQWIHVDPVRATSGPYGGTVAHGYLTLSLLPQLVRDAVEVVGPTTRINYGLEKVRFPAPLLAGSAVRAVVEVRTVVPGPGGTQLGLRVVLESATGGRPVCVAETLTLLIP